MTYHLRKFKRTHRYVDLCKRWWGQRRGVTLSDLVLSDYGFMVLNDEGEPLAAAFLYPVKGCASALIGFPIANPDVVKEERHQAIHILTTAIELEAKKLKYSFLVSYAGNKAAAGIYEREGYKVYDTEVVNYGKVL